MPAGLVRPPVSHKRHLPERRVTTKAPVSELVVDEEGSDQGGVIWLEADAIASVSLITVESRAALAAFGAAKNARLPPTA